MKKICLLALLLLAVACQKAQPSPTPTPTPTHEEKLESLRQNILDIYANSDSAYFSSEAFLDLLEAPVDFAALGKLARPVHSMTSDGTGKLAVENNSLGIACGPYVITTKYLKPNLPKSKDEIPLPSQPPFMADEDYQQFVKNFKDGLPDFANAKTVYSLPWEESPVSLQEVDSKELSELGIMVLEIVSDGNAKVCDLAIGDPGALRDLDLLVFPQYDLKASWWIEQFPEFLDNRELYAGGGKYMMELPGTHTFYFNASVLPFDFGAPVFAFSKKTLQPELVGIVVGSGAEAGVETRASATRIDYILELLKK